MKFAADADAAVRKLRLAARNTESARREGAELVVRGLVIALSSRSPRDTNRYVRGWLIAGRMAGVSLPLPSLKESKYHAAYVILLERWVATCERRLRDVENRIEFMYPNGRPRKGGRAYDRLNAKADAARARLDQARRDLDTVKADPFAAVFHTEKFRTDGHVERSTNARGKRESRWVRGEHLGVVSNDTRDVLDRAAEVGKVSIRTKVYGGYGALRHVAGKTLIHLRNLEAHSAIVEARKGVAKSSLAALGLKNLNARAMLGLRLALRKASHGQAAAKAG